MCTFQSKGRSKLFILRMSTITYLHKQNMVGEWPIMSLPVLIAKTECKSSANSLHCMNSFFPFSLQPPSRSSLNSFFPFSLQPPSRSSHTFYIAGLPSLRGSPYNTAPFKKLTSRSQVKKKSWLVLCIVYVFHMCADERYYSINVFYRLVPPLRTLKVTLSFPAKDTWA